MQAAEQSARKILVVDDDETLGQLFKRIFEMKGYEVAICSNGQSALNQIDTFKPDLLISDIDMPNMNGFELFEQLDKYYPLLVKVLMTGHSIEDYMRYIRQHNVGNVLLKGGNFNISEITDYISLLLDKGFFGLQKWFPNSTIRWRNVATKNEALAVSKEVIGDLNGRDAFLIELSLNELITNAVFHAILKTSDLPREQWNENYHLPKGSEVTVSWTRDHEKMGISVNDPIGALKKDDVLRWFDNPITIPAPDNNEHGRGLQLIHKLIDRFIINIEANKQTECIILQYHTPILLPTGSKPIIIHQV